VESSSEYSNVPSGSKTCWKTIEWLQNWSVQLHRVRFIWFTQQAEIISLNNSLADGCYGGAVRFLSLSTSGSSRGSAVRGSGAQ
jgi:hypothetical protein